MKVLEIDQLRKNMPKLKVDIASLEIEEGEIAVLLGGKQTGKSTLFKLLLNMLFPDFGTITVCGLDSRRNSEDVKQRMSAVLRRPGFLYSATLKQLKQMSRSFYDNWDETVFSSYMRNFGLLDSLIYGRIDNSSKKLFVLSLALAQRPRLLLMDEPFTQVESEAKEHIAQTLWQEQRQHGMSVLLTTAQPAEAARMADTLHILHQGSLLHSLQQTQLAEAAAELDWQSLPKHSRDAETARKIAQTEALFSHYTQEEVQQA